MPQHLTASRALRAVAARLPHLAIALSCAGLTHAAVAGATDGVRAGGGLVHGDTTRTASISAEVSLFGGEPFQQVDARYARTLTGGADPAHLSVGLALRLPDDTGLGWGGADGQARQWLDMDSGGLSFDGLADVFASGGTDGWHAGFQGQGVSQVHLLHHFDLLDSRPMQLTMGSEVGLWRDDDYRFALRYIDPKGGTAHTVWQDTVVYDDNWNPSRHFSQVIDLKAGSYALEVSLHATSFSTGDWQTAGRTLASFSLRSLWRDGASPAALSGVLTPVPEPSALWLLGAGLAVVVVVARRGTRTTCAPGAQPAGQ